MTHLIESVTVFQPLNLYRSVCSQIECIHTLVYNIKLGKKKKKDQNLRATIQVLDTFLIIETECLTTS